MYKKKFYNRNARKPSTENVLKRPLNVINENASLKIRKDAENVPKEKQANLEGISIFDDISNEPHSSEENIPASQEPSCRYLSQRSNFASTLGRTQSYNNSNRPPSTYFELTLTKAGVQFDEDDYFTIACDHVAFVARFRECLQGHRSYPENIETFKTGLKQALDPKSKYALKLLSGCTIISTDDVGERAYQSQDSMIVNFLMIDFLREHVLDVLLDKIEKIACENDTSSKHAGVPLLPLMLAQLRYAVLFHGQIIYERITRIFEQANLNGKMHIIASAELFLDASKHDEFTQLLLGTFESSSDFFNETIITALTNLFLSLKMQIKLRHKICNHIIDKNQCPEQLVPSLVYFMLKILSSNSDNEICELIDALRKILLHIHQKNEGELFDQRMQNELFNHIENGLIRSKKFYSNWQKKIAQQAEREFCSIDFIVLLILLHIKEDNALYIENILRRKIKNDNLSLNILLDAKHKFPTILEKYTKVLMGVLNDFLKEKNIDIANFAHSSYEILFQICESVQKSILKKLLEMTNDKSAKNMTNIALDLIKNLHRKHPSDIQNWAMLLMPLLDRLNEMTLPQTRLIYFVLCSIAYPPPSMPECPTLQEQINMLVQKQMISRDPSVRRQGLLGCAQLIDCIARVNEVFEGTENADESFTTTGQLPDGRVKIAAKLFERVKTANMHCPQSIGFFYDELAAVLTASKDEENKRGFLNMPFLFFINFLIMEDFNQNFLKHDTEKISISGVSLASLKCINKREELDAEIVEKILSICLKLSELVLSPPNSNATSSILVLPPTFNLLCVVSSLLYQGSLHIVDSILGCAIVLPSFFDDDAEDDVGDDDADDFIERIRNDYDDRTQKLIIDIYFHYANWLRQLVSSFTTQIDEKSRRKCLLRLSELVKVERKIRKLLTCAPMDYMPPKSDFITELQTQSKLAGKSRRSRKTAAQAKNLSKFYQSKRFNQTKAVVNCARQVDNIEQRSEFGVAGNIGKKQASKSDKFDLDNMYGPKEIYRQMEANIVLFLREKLNVTLPLPMENNEIGLREYHFILNDLVLKLESILGIEKLQVSQNAQYLAKPSLFINDISTQLRHVNANTKVLAEVIDAQLKKVNRTYGNVDLFVEDFGYVKACFNFSLRLFAAFFSWPEFAQDAHAALLLSSLSKLCAATERDQEEADFEVMIKAIFNEFLKYEPSILDLKAAVHLHKLLTNLRKFAILNEVASSIVRKQANDIRSLCKIFLQRKWYNFAGNLEKGARCNSCLDVLVKGFLKNSDFKRLQNIIAVIAQEVQPLKTRSNYLNSFPNFNRANFPILYRALCDCLLTYLNELITMRVGRNNLSKTLAMWEESCSILDDLIGILRETDIPRNFQIFLKSAHIYLKLVLQHGLPVMEKYLLHNYNRIVLFLKSVQTVTRFLHSLCCQARIQSDHAISNQIPCLRVTMESFVFRVKAMLSVNNCQDAWNTGLLRNKDIHGEIILSQSVASSSTNRDSDEEMPEDDGTIYESLLEPNDEDEEPTSTNTNVNSRDRNGDILSKIPSISDCI